LALASEVRAHLEAIEMPAGQAPAVPKAIIVPHAGFIYSGPIAASAYARLRAGRETIRRVVLFGPTHRIPIRSLALPSVDAFATPMGEVAVDRAAVADALKLPQVVTSDAPHAFEHSLEVQLPFLQAVLENFSIVPFAVGDATPAEVGEVIELLWGGEETLIVVSSDLSHYHRYADACRTDRATGEAILALSPTLDHEQACGATPINGLLVAARCRGLCAELLDLRNSGDTAGDKARVVGYASFAFTEPDRAGD
jgi:AmmeMemoRadiSam system protein B